MAAEVNPRVVRDPNTKVLVVGMLDSPHVARWLGTLVDLPVDFVLFPSTPHRRVHPDLQRLAAPKGEATVSIARLESRLSLVIWAVDLFARGRLRASLLRRRIEQEKPGLIHALELQHAGYTLHRAVGSGFRGPARIALTNYGSDIFWYRRFPRHQARLKELMSIADVYCAECERDVDAARAMGFRGEVLSVLPNAGGMSDLVPWSSTDEDMITQRTTVLIKGYTNFVGRAQDIITHISRNARRFEGWNVVVYSATLRARVMCLLIRLTRRDLRIHTLRKKSLTHAEMIELFASSAAYIGFSRSDGISTSFLEAMAHGAYPLQTSTACVDEWTNRGARFSMLDVNNPAGAVEELLRVLGNTNLRTEAARENRRVALVHLDDVNIGSQMREDYARVLGLWPGGNPYRAGAPPTTRPNRRNEQ